MDIFSRIRDRWQAARDPLGFAKRIGLNLNGRVSFYGVSRGMFGSEPWMISFGDNVVVAAECQFLTHDGGTTILRREHPELEWSAPIRVGNDVFLGYRTVVMPGVHIGDRVVIGACSVVTKNIPSNSVVAGNPARRLGTVDDYLEKLQAKSLGIGHLTGAEKDDALRRIYLNGGAMQ